MALSKRLRFEVMRRDNHTCRYCGGHAPDVVLTVDHVVPVALGGSDEPGNLVTACKDCNAGKTSSSPDAVTVDAVADDALRWAAAMKAAAEAALSRLAEEDAYADAFLAEWKIWHAGPKDDPEPIPLDPNWRTSVGQWRRAGLPIEMAQQAVRRGMTQQHVSTYNTFRYVAGICWNMVTELQEAAKAALKTHEEPTCSYCEKPHSECPYWSEWECPCCVDEPHDRGLCHATNAGFRQGVRQSEHYEPWRNMLEDVIEGPRYAAIPYRWVA